ncbi:8133_t:CDS:1, partial [Cetraspora pellucida]
MSSQETFKGEPIFEKVSSQETSTEIIPQDLYMDVHESKIVIPDLKNLDDEKYPPKVS